MLKGYFNYYGMRGNYSSLREYYWYVKFYVRKWLSRRSQRGKITWERMYGIMNRFNMERPGINEKDGPRLVRKVVFY